MKCPKCGGKILTIDTAQYNDTNETYRRKVCASCGNVVFTVEFEIEDTKEMREIWNTSKYGSAGGNK